MPHSRHRRMRVRSVSPQPTVSIGLPVYNGQRFLAEALDSLLSQTFTDFELIISDNASTDATEDICCAYARSDPRIEYRRNPENRGAAWNYNRVLALATGQFFKWAAHDDICAPTFLERCVETFRSESSAVVLVYARSTAIDEHRAALWEHWDRLDLREPTPHERIKRLVWNPPNMGTSIFGLIRTSALRQTRGHLAFPGADYVTLAELALLGEFREIPEVLFLRRFHRGMSRRANVTLADVAEWFQPGSSNRVILEYWPLLVQHLVSIKRAPLGFCERMRCCAALVPSWARVWRRQLQEELVSLPAELRRVWARRAAG
jgi:glycosyltransferase involved in cell wall biosynthesis